MRIALRYSSYLLIFLTVWFLWPRELDGANGRLGEAVVPDYRMESSRYVSVRDGKREVEMYSKKSNFDFLAHEMDSTNVTIYFYSTQGDRTVVTSDRGLFYMNEKRFHLQDNVRSESPDGFVMTSAETNYLLPTKHLSAPTPVQGTMKDNSVKIWGDRAEGDMESKRMQLFGNARANYKEAKRGLTTIRGDMADMHRDEEKVEFFKNVEVNQEKTKGTSQKATLYYAAPEKALRYMSLQEDVRLIEPNGKYTRSQVAEFFMPTDTIVLTGFPAVYDGDDAVTGDKITMYRTTGVVEVLSANAASNQDHPAKKEGRQMKASKEDDELIP